MLLYQDIVIIDKNYLEYLHSFDSRVRLNHPNSKERPNVAVLVDEDGQKWAIPLSHSEKKKDTDANLNLYGKNNKQLGHLKFNNMIPLVEGTYRSAFNSNDKNYDNLLIEQEKEIISIFDKEIKTRFEKALKIGLKVDLYDNLSQEEQDKIQSKMKFYNIFNNFPKLLKVAKEWDAITKYEDYLDKNIDKLNKSKLEIESNNLGKIIFDDNVRNILKHRVDIAISFKNRKKFIDEKIDYLNNKDKQDQKIM